MKSVVFILINIFLVSAQALPFGDESQSFICGDRSREIRIELVSPKTNTSDVTVSMNAGSFNSKMTGTLQFVRVSQVRQMIEELEYSGEISNECAPGMRCLGGRAQKKILLYRNTMTGSFEQIRDEDWNSMQQNLSCVRGQSARPSGLR